MSLTSKKILALRLTLLFSCLFLAVTVNAQTEKRAITIDYNSETGPLNTMFKECIGAGRANEGLRADWQQQLAYIKKECGFKYIRMHGLLIDDMAVYREDKNGNAEYNYQYVDALFDYLLSIDVKPFVELGFMPSALASGKETIFWWKGNVTPPKDYNKWEALIRNLVQHFTERYGTDEVKSWYFEVWNEPNLSGFWAGSQEEYFKLYSYSAKAVKSVNAAYRVGGPATAGAAWIPEMINYCHKNNVPIDFASTHAYGVKQGFLDEFGNSGTVLSKDPMAVSGEILNSRKEIAASPLPGLELHYTEWSASYTPADPIHDSYHEAAYILEKIKQVGTAANSMSYWVFTDIFEEAGPRFTPFHGGFGLLNTQGINKAAFHSYRLLNKLGGTALASDDTRSWAAKDSKGGAQLLLWDFTNTHPGDAINNQQYYTHDLPSNPKGITTVTLNNLPKGKYRLDVYKVGYNANDPYTAYLKMGSPANLTKAQVAALKKKSDGSPAFSETIRVKSKEAFTKQLEMNENDVYFLDFVKL